MTTAAQRPVIAELAGLLESKRLVVFDYDGTLAHLAVNWDALRDDLSVRTAELGFVSSFRPLWPEISRFWAEQPAHLGSIFDVIASHEEPGVRGQKPRDEIVGLVRGLLDRPEPAVAVFSANLHATVASGLAQMGLSSIRSIVGADDVRYWKPDPTGLRMLVDGFHLTPEQVIFVGDTERDAQAAEGVGVAFFRV